MHSDTTRTPSASAAATCCALAYNPIASKSHSTRCGHTLASSDAVAATLFAVVAGGGDTDEAEAPVRRAWRAAAASAVASFCKWPGCTSCFHASHARGSQNQCEAPYARNATKKSMSAASSECGVSSTGALAAIFKATGSEPLPPPLPPAYELPGVVAGEANDAASELDEPVREIGRASALLPNESVLASPVLVA